MHIDFGKKPAWFSHTEVCTVLFKKKNTPTIEYIYTPDNIQNHVQNQNDQSVHLNQIQDAFFHYHCAFYIHYTMSWHSVMMPLWTSSFRINPNVPSLCDNIKCIPTNKTADVCKQYFFTGNHTRDVMNFSHIHGLYLFSFQLTAWTRRQPAAPPP